MKILFVIIIALSFGGVVRHFLNQDAPSESITDRYLSISDQQPGSERTTKGLVEMERQNRQSDQNRELIKNVRNGQ